MRSLAEAALWAVVALPAAGAALLLLFPRLERAAAHVAVWSAFATAALAALVAWQRPAVSVPFLAGTDLGLAVDGLAALVAPTVAVVTLLVLVFAVGDIGEDQARFHGLMLLFAAAALLTVTATTLPALLFAWELMGATSYGLIGFWWRDEERVSAGLTAFVTTRTADLGLYLAAGAALAGGAGLVLADLPQASAGWRDVVAAGIVVAALGKAAQLPFAFWLSSAMAGPSPVSALLHSAAMVALGGYLLLRVEPLLAATGWAGPVTAWVGVLTAVVMGAVAVAQRDLKQLLAASTCAQIGFVVVGAGVGTVAGGTAQLVAHAATKAVLFLAAGAWLTALGTKQLAGLQGVARRWPLVGWTATAGALSLAGVAPLSLWATKDAVLSRALEQSVWLYAAGLVAAVLSAAYSAKILVVIWRRPADVDAAEVAAHRDEEEVGTGRIAAPQRPPLILLAFGAVVLGVLVLPPLGGAVADLVGETSPETAWVELLVSTGLAVAVLVVVFRRPLPEPAWLAGWLGLEKAAHRLVVTPVLQAAEALARFDDRVLDRAVDRTAEASVRLAGRSGRADDAGVDGGVEWVATQMRRLGQLARRPQTGQLHEYYLQAVVLLAIGAVLLVSLG